MIQVSAGAGAARLWTKSAIYPRNLLSRLHLLSRKPTFRSRESVMELTAVACGPSVVDTALADP